MTRHCVFAHFDEDNDVKPHIRHHIRELAQVCTTIDFVSTSPVSMQDARSLARYVTSVTQIENHGFDFGMWKRAMPFKDLRKIDELVLTNSSVVGPLADLAALFGRMEKLPVDIWSMTDNHEFLWHLQSYFLVFKRDVLHSQAFLRFWQALIPLKDKWQTILSYEIGLSTYLRECGFSLRAAFPYHEIVPLKRKRLKAINPTVKYPAELLEAGYPYIKVELLRDNPYNVRLNNFWLLAKKAGYHKNASGRRPVQRHLND